MRHRVYNLIFIQILIRRYPVVKISVPSNVTWQTKSSWLDVTFNTIIFIIIILSPSITSSPQQGKRLSQFSTSHSLMLEYVLLYFSNSPWLYMCYQRGCMFSVPQVNYLPLSNNCIRHLYFFRILIIPLSIPECHGPGSAPPVKMTQLFRGKNWRRCGAKLPWD